MPTSLSRNLASGAICFITSRGASSESLAMNVEMDFGPFASLLLNSLPLSSLHWSSVDKPAKYKRSGTTLRFPRPAEDNRIARTKCKETRPLAQIDARSRSSFV